MNLLTLMCAASALLVLPLGESLAEDRADAKEASSASERIEIVVSPVNEQTLEGPRFLSDIQIIDAEGKVITNPKILVRPSQRGVVRIEHGDVRLDIAVKVLPMASGLVEGSKLQENEPEGGLYTEIIRLKTVPPNADEAVMNEHKSKRLSEFLERLPQFTEWPQRSSYHLDTKSQTLMLRATAVTIAEVKWLLAAMN